MANRYHLCPDRKFRICVATIKNGANCDGCLDDVYDSKTGLTVPSEHIDGRLQLAKKGGATYSRATSAGNTRDIYIIAVNDFIIEVGQRTTVKDKNGKRLNYKERGKAFGYGKDLPAAFKLEEHSIPLYERKTNDPLAWEVHRELATIIEMGPTQWARTPLVDRLALMSNGTNRFMSTFDATIFSGHTSEFTQYGRTVADLQTGETVHTFPEALAHEKPETVVRHLVKQIASQRPERPHRLDKDFKFHFARFLDEQGLAPDAGITESSKDEAKAKAFAERRANRMKWHAFCDNGHESHSMSSPTSPRICMTCVEDGIENPQSLIFKQKVGV